MNNPFDPGLFATQPPPEMPDGGPIAERLSPESIERRAARAERKGREFCMPTIAGLAELNRMAGDHGPTIILALAIVRLFVATGKPYRLSREAAAGLGISERGRVTARTKFMASRDWFEVEATGNAAAEIKPTPAAVKALHYGRR